MKYPSTQVARDREARTLLADAELCDENARREKTLLVQHEATAANKGRFYAQFQELVKTDRAAATALWEKQKLGATWTRVEHKFAEFDGLGERAAAFRADAAAFLALPTLESRVKERTASGDFSHVRDPRAWQLPASRWKTFHDLFVPPACRLRPTHDGRFGRTDHDDIPLENAVTDPGAFPAWFLQEFGFATLPRDARPVARLAERLKAAPRVATLFQKAEPLNGYGRGGNPQPNYRFLRVAGEGTLQDGKLMHSYYTGAEPESSDRKVLQVFDSAYAARRQTDYAARGLTHELFNITAMEARVGVLQKKLAARGRDDQPAKEAAIRQAILEEIELLQGDSNYFKHTAHDILEDVSDLKDSLGRYNPGVACARLLRAVSLLKERLPQAFRISRYVSEDQGVVQLEIARSEAALNPYFDALRDLCHRLGPARRNPVFTGAENYAEQMRYLRRNLFEPMDSLPSLEGLPVRPFNLYAAKLQEKIAAVHAAVTARDFDATSKEATRAFIISKIFHVQQAVERTIHEISLLPFDTSLEVLAEKASALEELVLAREAFKDIVVDYYEVYHPLQEKILGWKRGIEHYRQQPLTPDERAAVYQRMKCYLEAIDFPAILAGLE